MADMIKNRYNRETIYKVAVDIKSVYEAFQIDEFMKSTMDESWEGLELKDRIIQISTNLGKYLPTNYSQAIGVIDKVVMNYGDWLDGFGGFFPIFVEINGQNEADWGGIYGGIKKVYPICFLRTCCEIVYYSKRRANDGTDACVVKE